MKTNTIKNSRDPQAAGLLAEHATLSAGLHCQTATQCSWVDFSADGLPSFPGFPAPKAVKMAEQ